MLFEKVESKLNHFGHSPKFLRAKISSLKVFCSWDSKKYRAKSEPGYVYYISIRSKIDVILIKNIWIQCRNFY